MPNPIIPPPRPTPTIVPIPSVSIPLVGPMLQIYRGRIRGTAKQKLDTMRRYADQVRAFGMPGIVWHGFPHELVHAWDALAALTAERGLLAFAAWGLDGRLDEDATRLTATEKGHLMGEVLAHRDCKAGLADAEGQWDDHVDPQDDMDEAGALQFGNALREIAPDAIVGSQPWFALDSHGELRRAPRPFGQGGPFAGYPVDEFRVRAVNWFDFPQAYCNESGFVKQYGERRYEAIFNWMERDWGKIEPALDSMGVRRERSITIQGYGWSLRALMHCLLDRWVRPQKPVIIWCESWPEADVLRAIDAVNRLVARGFAQPGRDPREAVRLFQVDHNHQAPVARKLDVDGWAGEKTLTALGV